jgi:uncharacterized protein
MSVPPFLAPCEDGCLLFVHIQPRSSRTRIIGQHGERLKIAVTSPPVEGAANKEIVKFLSKTLGVSRSDIEIRSGDTGRRKTLHVSGLSVNELKSLLQC